MINFQKKIAVIGLILILFIVGIFFLISGRTANFSRIMNLMIINHKQIDTINVHPDFTINTNQEYVLNELNSFAITRGRVLIEVQIVQQDLPKTFTRLVKSSDEKVEYLRVSQGASSNECLVKQSNRFCYTKISLLVSPNLNALKKLDMNEEDLAIELENILYFTLFSLEEVAQNIQIQERQFLSTTASEQALKLTYDRLNAQAPRMFNVKFN